MKTRKYNAKCKAQKGLDALAIKTGSVFIILLCALTMQAQEASLTVSSSYDTVYLGNPVLISYIYKNISCDHNQPEFPQSWAMRGGPNTSLMTSMVNGHTTREQSVSYMIYPQEKGDFTIPEISCGDVSTGDLLIYVVDNPEEIKQELRQHKRQSIFERPRRRDLNPSSPAPDAQEKQMDPIKAKRKTYKLK